MSKRKLSVADLESVGWNSTGRHSPEYMYKGNVGYYNGEYGSLRIDGTGVFIKDLHDLQWITRLLDRPHVSPKSYHDTDKIYT